MFIFDVTNAKTWKELKTIFTTPSFTPPPFNIGPTLCNGIYLWLKIERYQRFTCFYLKCQRLILDLEDSLKLIEGYTLNTKMKDLLANVLVYVNLPDAYKKKYKENAKLLSSERQPLVN